MPFELCNAPATFQRLMETILTGLTRKIWMVYIDNIIVLNQTFEDHLFSLEAGHGLSGSSWSSSQAKEVQVYFIKSGVLGTCDLQTRHWGRPNQGCCHQRFSTTHKSQVSQIFSRSSFIFIPKFSAVTGPLHLLTRKGAPFVWSSSCQEAFELLKHLLTTAPPQLCTASSWKQMPRCRTGGHVGAEQVAPAAPQIELCSNWVRGSWSCMGTKALSPVFVWLSVWCLYWPCCTQIALVYSPTFWQACFMGDGHPGAWSSNPPLVW